MKISEYIYESRKDRKMIDFIKEAIKNDSTDTKEMAEATSSEVVEALFEYIDEMPVNESKNDILSYIQSVKEGEKIDEGIFTGLLGAIGGIAFGPAIGKAICSALNIQKGVFYDLMTSRLVTGAICAKLGLRA